MDGTFCKVDLAILSASSFQAMPEWPGIHSIIVTKLRSLRASAANLIRDIATWKWRIAVLSAMQFMAVLQSVSINIFSLCFREFRASVVLDCALHWISCNLFYYIHVLPTLRIGLQFQCRWHGNHIQNHNFPTIYLVCAWTDLQYQPFLLLNQVNCSIYWNAVAEKIFS